MSQQALLPGMVALPQYGDEHDFYSTPPSAVEAVLPFIPRLRTARWNVLEPAAGEGAILKALLPHANEAECAIAIEINRARFAELAAWAASFPRSEALGDRFACVRGDFLGSEGSLDTYEVTANPWLIPLNPPYSKPYEGIGLDFVERCLQRAERVPGSVVAGLLPLDFATGVDRCKRVHDRWKGSLYPLRRRQDFGGPHGSGQRPVAWFVWDLLNPKNEYQVIG